jgi:hypothetical protein
VQLDLDVYRDFAAREPHEVLAVDAWGECAHALA